MTFLKFKCLVIFLEICVKLSFETFTSDDKQKIEKCYETEIFSSNILPQNSAILYNEMKTAFYDQQKSVNFCKAKASLDQCLTSDIIENFINLEVFNESNFDVGRLFLANYFQLDFICKNQWILNEKLRVKELLDDCEAEESQECGDISDYLKCIRYKSSSTSHCKNDVFCYAKKFAAYQSCYRVGHCEICDTLSFAKNDINNLCNHDVYDKNESILLFDRNFLLKE